MNFRRLIPGVFFLCLFLSQIAAGDLYAGLTPDVSAQPGLIKNWFDQNWDKRPTSRGNGPIPATPVPGSPGTRSGSKPDPACRGWIVGQWAEAPTTLFCQQWPYRAITYEIFFPSKKEIARTIYGLALFTKDLDPTVTLERFEKGAGGFHYSMDQIVSWANALKDGKIRVYTEEEQTFLDRLTQDQVMVRVEGRYVSLGVVRHILGAAPKNNRPLTLNLDHERLHVLWDEDPRFQETWIAKWSTLTSQEKEAVYAELKGYDKSNEKQVIEEWCVRQNEDQPVWKKGK